MLLELSIRNIALIDKLNIRFDKGLNILTGETGAGKSIVVDSVALTLGSRVDRDMIRSGEENAAVQAAFDISGNTEVLEKIREYGIDPDGDVITVGRELSLNGKNICRICGNIVSLNQLRSVSACLMDMHGQHEHQKLLNPATHLTFIDHFGDADHKDLITNVARSYSIYRDTLKQLNAARMDNAERVRLIDMLRFQIEEIDAVKPKRGELEKLEMKAKVIENASLIAGKVESAYGYIYAGTGRSISAQDAVKRACDAMNAISEFDARFSEIAKRLNEAYYDIQDIGIELQDINEGIDYDPGKLVQIEDRLDALKRLIRKYGPEIDDVLAFRENAAKRLEMIENADAECERLEKEVKNAEKVYLDYSEQLSGSRKKIAAVFCEAVKEQLSDLGMPKIKLETRFTRLKQDKYTANGIDDIELMISPNPGEPLKPLASIASGGELARIMLAFKTVRSTGDDVGTMVFDEIDTGVSGRIAQAVGEKMCLIASQKQVICVTHLPQIAALGDSHYLVEKKEDSGRTHTLLRKLDFEGRIFEIARLVGGADGGASAYGHAESMLRLAEKKKEEIR